LKERKALNKGLFDNKVDIGMPTKARLCKSKKTIKTIKIIKMENESKKIISKSSYKK
jgi:hypothetical protein